MKRTISNLIFAAAALLAACGDDWHDASLSPQRRAELLTAQMTLDEKIGQLQSPYGWEMYERRGDSVVLTDRFRQAVEEEHIGMMWGAFRADPWTQKNLETGLTPRLAARLECSAMPSSTRGWAFPCSWPRRHPTATWPSERRSFRRLRDRLRRGTRH